MSLLRLLALTALGLAATVSAEVAGVTVLDQAQVDGAVGHPGDPELPWGRPVGAILARSTAEGGGQYIELKPAALSAGTVVVLVHPGNRGRELRLFGIDGKGKRKELGRATLKAGAWQSCSAAIADATDLERIQLASGGVDPLWLAGAALRVDGESRLSDLELTPNPLLEVGYDGSQGVTQVARTLAAGPLPSNGLRILVPGTGSAEEKAGADNLAKAIAAGWNTTPPPNPPKPDQTRANRAGEVPATPAVVADANSVRWYENATDLPKALERALADLPQLLVINLSSARSPSLKPDAMAKLVTQANRSGVMVAVLLDERPSEGKSPRDWQQWITVMRQAAPALGIIDQQAVHDWYEQPGATPAAANPVLGEVVDRTATITVGFADLRARYEWWLFEAKLELLPSDNPRRRPRLQR